MNCPVCGSPYRMGTDAHENCRIEQKERVKDAEFVRAFRHELAVRGLGVTDFLSLFFSTYDYIDPYGDT